MKRVLYLTIFLIFVEIITARCPNSCSGHGICSVTNACVCYKGWTAAPDCSQRLCPTGPAWADKAYALDLAHQLAECSNAGTCDRTTGRCQCFDGFTGSACQRSTCPNDCSGHGVCSTLREISSYTGPDYNSLIASGGDGFGYYYNNWDANSIQLCECDQGYFGSDCSQIMCPKGDDPLTANQNYRAIHLHVQVGLYHFLSGRIGLEFQGTTVFVPLLDLTDASCSELLTNQGKFGTVSCTYVFSDRFYVDYYLVFYSWPTYPKDNNLYDNNGNPQSTDFYCDISYTIKGTVCTFTDITSDNIQEYATCSNRGTCDYTTGQCDCLDGFGGAACSNMTYLHTTTSPSSPGMAISMTPLNYTGTFVALSSTKSKASDFYFLEAFANGESVFSIRGDGLTSINQLKTLSGGQTISAGGLNIQSGGVSIMNTGMFVYSTNVNNPVARVKTLIADVLDLTYTTMELSSLTTDPTSHYLLTGVTAGNQVFAIRADGATYIRGGGLSVTQGMTIYSGGATVTGGVTVQANGLRVNAGGAIVTGGLTVYSNGMTIRAGGMNVYGGASINSGGLKVYGGMSINSGGMSITGGATISLGGLQVTGGLTISSLGLQVSGGSTIVSGGLNIVTGGLTVMNTGMVITSGGFTISNGGMYVNNGLSIGNGGLTVTGGATVVSGGFVAYGGLSIIAGGATAMSGLTIGYGGASITGGVTVLDSGMTVSGGVTVNSGLVLANGGIRITGGVTLYTTGINSAGGCTLSGITVQAASTFTSATFTSGVVIQGGLTVQGNSFFQNSPAYSDRRLKTNILPIGQALTKVNQLQGVYYHWIDETVGRLPDDLQYDTKRHVGLIAQDVDHVLPEIVQPRSSSSNSTSYLTVDYPGLIPLLVEAMHDLSGQVEALQEHQQQLQQHDGCSLPQNCSCPVNEAITTQTNETTAAIASRTYQMEHVKKSSSNTILQHEKESRDETTPDEQTLEGRVSLLEVKHVELSQDMNDLKAMMKEMKQKLYAKLSQSSSSSVPAPI